MLYKYHRRSVTFFILRRKYCCFESMRKIIILVMLVFSFTFCGCKISERNFINKIETTLDPDIFRNVSGLISSKGYPVEDHTVQTVDGFILSVQRIPHGRKSYNQGDKKKVVFLQHGLLSNSAGFVVNFPEQSLGFILADAGYDVWMGNSRGNIYSRRHTKYSPDQREFWDYSFDEMAQYDLPATIDYILNITGEETLYYVGHSQGTTSAFALLSESPEYNEKIKLFIALAPVATVGYMTSAISYLAPFTDELDFLYKNLGWNEFHPSSAFRKVLTELVCDADEKFLCKDIIFLICGADKYQLNMTRIGVYSVQLSDDSSTKSVIHYAQMVNSKLFTKYDYGEEGNMEHYNQTTPPEYNVARISTPVALFWSLNDKLADPVDVNLLREKLKSMVSSYCVPFPQFNHVDFLAAIHAHKLVYDHVLSLLAHH